MNNSFLHNHKALIQGILIIVVVGLVVLISGTSFYIIDPSYVSTPIYVSINIISFIFCWLLLAFLLDRYSTVKILVLVGVLIISTLADNYLTIENNPLTIPFVILFWLGLTYFIIPQFFKKYQIAILTVYGLVILYYLFLFSSTPKIGIDSRSNIVNFIILPVPVFAALWIYEQWRWLKTLEAGKAQAELAFFKAQVDPHFFFNTLNNLYGLVVEQSIHAPDVILKLSDMMRYTIYEGKESFVKLADEINYLENYIDLHKIRYQKKVDIQFTHKVDGGVQITPLLFITLLENGFKHGVESLTESAYIHMNIITTEGKLLFTIENNYEQTNPNRKRGIGLDNLKKRLLLIYPKRHELTIDKTENRFRAKLKILLQQ